jgi:CheY-like chemotaxis protein
MRKRILLIAAAPPDRDRISTFLSTMGWTCTVSVQQEVLAAIEREPFDAVLLDLGPSGTFAERTILHIKEIRPSLSDRIVVISRGNLDPQTLELIERHNLAHLPHERLFSQLWITLEDLFLSRGLHKPETGNPRFARLLFDSSRLPSPTGVRTSRPSGRHSTYEHNGRIIEVFLDRPPGSERVSLLGQVMDATKGGRGNVAFPVVLADQSGTLARTTTNHFGEFNLEFKSAENVRVEIRLGERSWVAIPVGPMDWVKGQSPSEASRT